MLGHASEMNPVVLSAKYVKIYPQWPRQFIALATLGPKQTPAGGLRPICNAYNLFAQA